MGETFGNIIPSRGIKQGDLISPYLFLLCAEGFSNIIQRYEERKWIYERKVANGAPIITHCLRIIVMYTVGPIWRRQLV